MKYWAVQCEMFTRGRWHTYALFTARQDARDYVRGMAGRGFTRRLRVRQADPNRPNIARWIARGTVDL